MTPKFPPRRLLAVAAALALIGGQADAVPRPGPQKASSDESAQSCPLGVFHCPPRPPSYAMCRPNAMLAFYDPTLDKDPSRRDTSDTQVTATTVDSSNRTVYHLSGDVKLQRADQKLQADSLDYNDTTTDYDANGNVRYQDAGELLSATHMHGNTEASHGIADNVSYQMLSARGNGVARQGQMLDAEHSRYESATYSTCDVGHHVWEFRAKSITTDKTTGVGTARGATMRVGKVPLIYLPYFTFPLDDRRKSGFLYPTLGKSSRAGFQVSTPYYLNLAPNYDATLDPRIYTLRGPMLAGEFRYLVPGSHGQLNFQYVPNDRGESRGLENTTDKRRYMVNFKDNTKLGQSWRFVTSINRVSDSSYLYDYGNDLSSGTVYSLTSSAAIVGGGNWWHASFGGSVPQNVNPFVTDSSLQYRKLPALSFGMDVPLGRWLDLGMDSEAVAFRKPDYVEGQREDLYPYLAGDFGTSAWFVRPRLAYRYTAYQLNGGYQDYGYYGHIGSTTPSPFTQKSPSRALPIASIDSGLVFDRSTSLFGTSYTQTLEPRLYYLYVPYRNQDNLPLFDTNRMSFDYWQLFSPNQFSGADRQMNANNLTAAITTRLLDEGGVEMLSASIGQIRYFTPQRVQLPNGSHTTAAQTDWTRSDYVAQINLQLDDQWRLNSTYQWSPNTRRTDMGTLELQRRLGTNGILNFAYRYRRGLLEQYSTSAVYSLSDRWRLMGAWTWSVPDHRTMEALLGIQYDSCCVSLRLVDRNYVDEGSFAYGPNSPRRDINRRNNAIMFEIEFKGLGSTSSQIDPLLHRDILGYQ